MGAAKEGAAGSVIVAKRRDSRVQRRASSAAAAAILALVTCASVALLQLLALEAGAVFAQQLWMRFGKAVAYEPGYASRLVAPRNQCYDGTAQQMRSRVWLD